MFKVEVQSVKKQVVEEKAAVKESVEYVSDNPLENARLHKESLAKEILRLKRQATEVESLPAAIKRAEAELVSWREKEQQALKDKELERLSLLARKQKTLPHGDLISNLVFDEVGSPFLICREHPNSKIAYFLWDTHVGSYDLHDFLENSPLSIRRRREELEREKLEKEKEADHKFAEQQRKKSDMLRKNGFVPA